MSVVLARDTPLTGGGTAVMRGELYDAIEGRDVARGGTVLNDGCGVGVARGGGTVLDGGCGVGVALGATDVPAGGVTVTPAFILKLFLPKYTTPLFSPPSTGCGTSSPPSAFGVLGRLVGLPVTTLDLVPSSLCIVNASSS